MRAGRYPPAAARVLYKSDDPPFTIRTFLASSGRGEHQEQLLHINVQRFRGGLVFKAHGRLYHSTLGLGVIKKKIPGRDYGRGSVLPARRRPRTPSLIDTFSGPKTNETLKTMSHLA